jgi:alpha-1,6-mannosyltransferase
MKLVDVSEFYAERGGGVRAHTNAKLAAGAALGHEVVVIAPGPADREERRLGGRVVWIGSPPMPLDPRYYLLLRERAVHAVLDREQPDVVEGSSPWTGGIFCARWRGRALKSFVFHQDPVAVYPQTLLGGVLGSERVDRLCAPFFHYLRALSHAYDLTLTSGAWLSDRLRRHGLRAPSAVPFGIDKQHFSAQRRSATLRATLLAECGLPESAALLIAVGRHHPEKRLSTLISAVELLQRTRPVGLVLYGDGPLRALLQRRAARVPGVRILGSVARGVLAQALASADALVHGSSAETFGLAVAEAICSGLPVVVPDAGGAAELARPAYAECYPAGDAQVCAAAIARLLARDPAALRAAAIAAGEQLVWSEEAHFAALFALYAQRLPPRTSAAA